MDEELQGFGLAESAKARESQSSWGLKELFFICCSFCFCVLLLVGDEFSFSFFMVVMTFDIYQMRILHYFGDGHLWRANVVVYEEVFYYCEAKFLDSNLSFFLHLFSFVVFKFVDVSLLWVFLTKSSNEEVCEGWMP